MAGEYKVILPHMTTKESDMVATNFRQVACYLTPEQHDRLRELSDETMVPMQAILRQAVNDILAKHHKLPKRVDEEYLSKRIIGLKKGAKK